MMIPLGIADRRRDRRALVRRALPRTAGPTSRRSSSARTSRGTPRASASSSSRGPWFYLPVVFSDSFPWSLCLFGAAALWFARSRARRARRGRASRFRIRTLLWLWILVIVGFFSLSAAKQDLYIFPIVPAVAALAGLFIARATTARSASVAARCGRRRPVIGGLLLAVAGAGTSLPLRDRRAGLRARRRRARRRRRRRSAAPSRCSLALAPALARRARRCRARAHRAQLGVRPARASELRALQAGPASTAAIQRARRPGRRRRALQRRAAEHGLLPRAGTSMCSSIATPFLDALRRRSHASTRCCRRATTTTLEPQIGVPTCVLERAADGERQAEGGPRAGSAAGGAADYQPVPVGSADQALSRQLDQSLEAAD